MDITLCFGEHERHSRHHCRESSYFTWSLHDIYFTYAVPWRLKQWSCFVYHMEWYLLSGSSAKGRLPVWRCKKLTHNRSMPLEENWSSCDFVQCWKPGWNVSQSSLHKYGSWLKRDSFSPCFSESFWDSYSGSFSVEEISNQWHYCFDSHSEQSLCA